MSNHDYDPEANASTGSGSHIVFDPEVRPKFPPTGDVTTTFVVLPARPLAPIPGWDVAYEAQYVKYRRYDVAQAEGKPHKFSHWIRQYYVHEWVGGESNIISPKTYLDEKISAMTDPVRTLAEYMANRGNLWHLFGLEPNGKKSQNKERADELFRGKLMPRYASRKFLLNTCLVGPDSLEECVPFSLPEAAVVNRSKADEQGRRAEWGLFDELNRKSRGVPPVEIKEDPSKAYFWGDITDPQGALPVSFYKEKPPTGGAVKMWVAKPAELNLRQISVANLLRRLNFASDEKLFVEYSATRIVRELVRLFGVDHPDVLVGALGNAYPIRRMIDDMHSGSEEEHDAGDVDDEIAMTHPTTVAVGAPKSAPAAEMPAQRTYAPPASVIESKVQAYWVSVNKATPISATLDEAKALAAANLLGVVMLMPKDQGRAWGNAQEYGFAFKQSETAPPPPPAAEAPPPPPSDPAPPPPPAPSAPPAVIESSLPPLPPAMTETAPTTSPGVTKEMLMAQLTGGKTSDPESAPPPPPPPAV